MRAAVMVVRNPFDPLASRQMGVLRRPRKIRALVPRNRPAIAILNGKPVLRAGWRRKLRDGDHLVVCTLPRGGGGRGGGSNPLRFILSIAMIFLAPYLAGAILGVPAAAVGSTLLGQATTTAIMLAGQIAINALLPTPQPDQPPQPSPTYTLQAQGNQARIEQAIPVQYGRLLVYPDLAAQPYTEFAGNEQYVYQLLCVGAGEYDIEEVRIEDTEISAFSEIETEIVLPDDPVTLFPTQVISAVEVSGQELLPRRTATWSRSGTTVTITETDHNRAVGQAVDLEFSSGSGPDGKYLIATVADEDTFTVETASGSGSGSVYVRSIQGGLDGYVAAPAGTVAHRLAVDLIMPPGLHTWDGDGNMLSIALQVIIEAQQIDDDGEPLGSWFELGDETITDRTTTPKRETRTYDLDTPGRYRVRAWRVDEKTTATGAAHEVVLAGLRSYLVEDEEATFGGVTLIAMRMRATNNLSLQASRKVSVLATRKLPVWNGTSWSAPQATRSIAWAIADAARDSGHGAGLPDTRIDLDALLALDAIWAAREDWFDGRFDQAGSWWEAVSQIALAGRARCFMQGGRLRVVRDGADQLPVAMYGMRNIVRGSFSVDYIMPSEDTADAIEVQYFDASTWAPRRVTAALPDSTAEKPAKLDLSRGITDRAQALREGTYHAATNRYRRRVVRFATEMEGFIPSIGDTIAVSHDMPGWGQHGEATGWDAASRTLTVSEPMEFGAGQHYVALRRADGGVSGPWAVSAGTTAHELLLDEDPDITPYTGTERERTHVAFGAAETYAAMAKVVSVRPRGEYEVEIEAVPDDPSVHTADEGVTAPPIRTSQLPGRIVRPVVDQLFARRMPGDPTRVLLGWQPAAGAEGYQIEMAEGDDVADPDVSWTRIADTTAAHHAVRLLYAARTLVRVRGVGLAAGNWRAAALGDLIPNLWNTDTTPMWTIDSNAMWSS